MENGKGRKATYVEWGTLFFTIGAYLLGFYYLYLPQTKFQQETVNIAQTQTKIQSSVAEVQRAKDQILTEIAMIEEKTKGLEKDLTLKEMRVKASLDAYKAIHDIRPKLTITGLTGVVTRPDQEPNVLRLKNKVEIRFLIKNVGLFDVHLNLPKIKVTKMVKEESKSLTAEVKDLEENKDYIWIYVGPHNEFLAHPNVEHRSHLLLWFRELDEDGEYNCRIEWEYRTGEEIVKIAKSFLKDFIAPNTFDKIAKGKMVIPVRLVIEEIPEGF